MSKLKVFEAFAGIGSQQMALRNIGINYEVVAISEIDKYAIDNYNKIHGKTLNVGDISKVKEDELPEHDLFTYSFPCTDISMVGKKKGFEKGSGTSSSLLWECERVIKVVRPKYLVLENVKALVNRNNIDGFNKWLDTLKGYGYTNYWKVLNAKDYGIPQNRERVFVVSILGEHSEYNFNKYTGKNLKLVDILERGPIDERYYITDERIPIIRNRFALDGKHHKIDLVGSKGINIDKVQGTLNIGASASYGVGYKDDISGTLRANNHNMSITDLKNIRRLTPLECWRLMGFSDEDFNKASVGCSNTQLYKQAGNSIVVTVLEQIFRDLFLIVFVF